MSGQCGNNYNQIYCEDIPYEEMREIMENHVPDSWECETCGNIWSSNLDVCILCGETE